MFNFGGLFCFILDLLLGLLLICVPILISWHIVPKNLQAPFIIERSDNKHHI
jgi:hypothetical protein